MVGILCPLPLNYPAGAELPFPQRPFYISSPLVARPLFTFCPLGCCTWIILYPPSSFPSSHLLMWLMVMSTLNSLRWPCLWLYSPGCLQWPFSSTLPRDSHTLSLLFILSFTTLQWKAVLFTPLPRNSLLTFISSE